MRGGRESRLALAFVLAAAVMLGASWAGAESTANLRQRQHALAARSQTALLGLYALDAQLSRARGELARLQSRAATLRTQEEQVREEAAIVARNLRVSQRMLGAHLRALYEQGEPDAIAILLGSRSLDDAVTRLNELEQSARQGAHAVTQSQDGREQLARLAARLAAKLHQTQALEARAAQTTAALARTRAARVAYLASLARTRRLTARQIATLDVRARQVVTRDESLSSHSAVTAAPIVLGARTITVTATGYTLPGHTATGLPVGPGVVAVDPSVIPLGTRMTIPGYGEGVAADTGGAVSGYTIDLWFATPADALAWGRRTLTITLH